MCPTPTGRIHTRTAAIILPALFGLIVSLVTGHFDWLALVGIYYIQGILSTARCTRGCSASSRRG